MSERIFYEGRVIGFILERGIGETLRIVRVGGEEMLQYSGYLFKKKQP